MNDNVSYLLRRLIERKETQRVSLSNAQNNSYYGYGHPMSRLVADLLFSVDGEIELLKALLKREEDMEIIAQ